jgi:hypothetical protein
MNFDWKSYLQLADELINHQNPAVPQEAYLRSAISRSYYAYSVLHGIFSSAME